MEMKDYALWLLAKREYGVEELRLKLKTKYPNESSAELLKEFQDKEWVSDERFVRSFIHDQAEYRKCGPQKITYKLKQKGIEDQLIQQGIEEYFPVSAQEKTASALAEKKWSILTEKEPDKWKRREKVQRFLAGRGFDYSVIKKVFDGLRGK